MTYRRHVKFDTCTSASCRRLTVSQRALNIRKWSGRSSFFVYEGTNPHCITTKALSSWHLTAPSVRAAQQDQKISSFSELSTTAVPPGPFLTYGRSWFIRLRLFDGRVCLKLAGGRPAYDNSACHARVEVGRGAEPLCSCHTVWGHAVDCS
jgi:hypothetical protein